MRAKPLDIEDLTKLLARRNIFLNGTLHRSAKGKRKVKPLSGKQLVSRLGKLFTKKEAEELARHIEEGREHFHG